MDFYWDKSFVTEQIDAFETQVGWAVEKGLPLSIHSRKATPEIIHSLKKFQKSKLKGVFHSFSGSKETANELSLLGDFYFGINGVVTFKNSNVVVLNADHELFSFENLVQIAGRVGRHYQYRHGDIWFLVKNKNRQITKAIKFIKECNE